MRRLVRSMMRLVGGALVVVVIVAGALLVTAHTEWGRGELRARLEAALARAIPGGARVGRIEGSLLGTLVARDVVLAGRDHRPVVTVATLRARIALWPLVLETVQVDDVVAEDVRVQVRRQPPGPPPGPRGAPSPWLWRVSLPRVAVRRATVELTAGATTQTIAAIDATGAIAAGAEGITISGWGHGRWQNGAADAVATGTVVIDDRVRIPGGQVTLGGAAIVVSGLAIERARPSGAAVVWAPAGALGALVPALGAAIPGELVADLALAATGHLVIDARAGDAALHAQLDGEPVAQTGRGVIAARGIDLAAATGRRLAGRGAVIAALDGGAAGLRGTLLVHCEPREAADCGGGAAPLRDAMVALDAAFDAPGGPALRAFALGEGAAGLQAFASAAGHRAGGAAGPIVVDELRAAASARGTAVAGYRIAGAITATAQATGTLAPALDLDVRARLLGGGLAIAGGPPIALATATGALHLRLGAAPRLDHAELEATGLRYGEAALGGFAASADAAGGGFRVHATARPRAALALELHGLASRSATATELAVQRIRISQGAIAWSGTRGAIAITEHGVALRDLALGAGDAAVIARGELDRPAGAFTAHLDASGLSGASFGGLAQGGGGAVSPGELDPPTGFDLAGAARAIRGRGTLDLARRGGRWQIDARLVAEPTAVAGVPPSSRLRGSARVELVGSRATLAAELHAPQLGTVELAFDTTAPRDPFDLTAWRALDRAAIHQAAVTLGAVQLAGLAELTTWVGLDPPRTGQIDGAVDLAPTALRGGFAIHGVELPFGAITGELGFAPRDGELGAQARARVPGIAGADLTARFALPAHPFDPATWQRGGRDLLREATLDLDDVPFDPALLAQLGVARRLARHGISVPLRGRATLALALGAAANRAELSIDLAGVTGGALVEPISQHVAIVADPATTRAHVAWTTGGARRLGTLDAELPVSADRWLAEPAAALRAPLTAQWTLPALPLPVVLGLFGHHEIIAGTLEGSAAIRGTLAAPIAAPVRVVARDAQVAPPLGAHPPPALVEIAAVGQLDATAVAVELTGRDATGGAVHATARARFDALGEVTGTIRATRLDVSPLGALLPHAGIPTAGTLDAQLALTGAARPQGSLKLTGGVLPIAPSIGTLHDVAANVALGATTTGTLDGTLGRGTVHGEFHTVDRATVAAALALRDVVAVGGLRPIITAQLEAPCIELRVDQPRLCGDVIVTSGHVTIPERPGAPLLDPHAPPDLILLGDPAAAAPAQPAAGLAANLVLRDIQVEASSIDSIGFRTTLRSRGKLAVSLGDPIGLVGDLAIDGGDVDLLGRRYVLSPSELRFDGSADPTLALQLSHEFAVLTLNVAISGRASHPDRPRLTSDPGGYTDDQLWGFLVGGEPGGDPTLQTREALVGAGTRLVSSTLGRRLSKVLPVKLDLSCEPATAVSRASCSGGKWVSDRLFLSYRQLLDPQPDENAAVLDLQYRLGRKSFELSGGDRAHLGLDVVWRWRQ